MLAVHNRFLLSGYSKCDVDIVKMSSCCRDNTNVSPCCIIAGLFQNTNASCVEEAEKVKRSKMKSSHEAKQERDRMSRQLQQQRTQERKEKEKKRTQKQERRR